MLGYALSEAEEILNIKQKTSVLLLINSDTFLQGASVLHLEGFQGFCYVSGKI